MPAYMRTHALDDATCTHIIHRLHRWAQRHGRHMRLHEETIPRRAVEALQICQDWTREDSRATAQVRAILRRASGWHRARALEISMGRAHACWPVD